MSSAHPLDSRQHLADLVTFLATSPQATSLAPPNHNAITKSMMRMLRFIRRIEEEHGYAPFDLRPLAIFQDDTNASWTRRCIDAVRGWLIANRTT